MPGSDAAQLWKLNQRLLTRVMNAAAPRLASVGLETKEFFVLDEVDTSRHPAELAATLMLPKASVTVYLRNLVAKGLVVRTIDETDLRRHHLATTDAGKRVLRESTAALATEFAAMMDRLDAREQGEFHRLLERLVGDDG